MDPDEFIPTRASLLGRLKDWDDQTSWREFFDTYWRLIYGVARKAGLTDAEAQDTVQETLLAVAKKMPGFTYDPAVDSFKGWLLTVTQWKVTDQFRKRPGGKGQSLFTSPARSEEGTRTAIAERVTEPAVFDLLAIWDQALPSGQRGTDLLEQDGCKWVEQNLECDRFEVCLEKIVRFFKIKLAMIGRCIPEKPFSLNSWNGSILNNSVAACFVMMATTRCESFRAGINS